jgi:Major capsid protein N-terminus
MNIEALGGSWRTEQPEMSYFKEVYKKNSQCSHQIIPLQFPINYSYGEETVIDLYQEGDIITDAYISFTYPAGQPTAVCDSFGTYMLNWVQLEYGDQLIERIDGEFLEMMNDLTVPQAKQGALSNLVGKYLTSNLATYNVKLPFSCFNSGLPICALKENPFIRFSLRNFYEGCASATAINPPFNAILFVTYVFLPEPERNYFIKNSLTYLFEQTQRYDTTGASSNVTVYTEFQNPTKELFIVIQSTTNQPYQWPDQLSSMRFMLNNSEIITYDLGTSRESHTSTRQKLLHVLIRARPRK